MSEKLSTALIWFRNDLRTIDHQGLKNAVESGLRVIACYIFNPNHYRTLKWGFKKTDRFRAQFLIESVKALQNDLEELNISLIIDKKKPEKVLPELIKKYNVKEIFLQHEWTEEEKKEEENVSAQIDSSIKWNRNYEQFLFHPSDLPFSRSQVPEIFGAFRKRCEKEVQVRPCLPPPVSLDTSNLIKVNDNLPDLSELNLPLLDRDQRSAFPFLGGTDTGIKRLDQYFWKSKKLSFYKKTRNGLLGVDYSSKFSPWLANGSISPKTIYWEIIRYEKEIQKNQSTYWLVFELIWRDYFKYISLKHENKIFIIESLVSNTFAKETYLSLFRLSQNRRITSKK